MVQDMSTPVFISQEHYKSNQVYINGMNGSPTTPATTTATTTTTTPLPTVAVQQHLINTNNTESSPTAMHMPIPIPVPMPMLAPMTHHHPHHPPPQAPQQPFFPSMGPPTMTAPAIVTPTATAAAQLPPPVSEVGTAPPSIHQTQQQQQQQPSLYNSPTAIPDQNYCDYLYHVGFLQGLFSDITVNVPAVQKSFALHSLILTRSPILYRRLVNLGVHHHHHQQHPLIMDLDIAASPETIHTIIGHLYRPLTQQDLFFIVNEKPQICFELLDATQKLELEALQNHILHVLGMSLNQNNVFYWISALLSISQQQRKRLWTDLLDQQIVHYLTFGLPKQLIKKQSSSSSTSSPPPPRVTAPISSFTDELSSSSPLQDDVNFGTCVQVVDPSTTIEQGEGEEWFNDIMDTWARVYAELPLKYLKRCLEHKDLMVKSSIERYKFAKKTLYFRSQFGKNGLTVLLQFSRVNNSGILIVKKQSVKFGRWDPLQI
ncbi:hypothetical protein INT45_012079 [Circinella minor]|uniref:BTB domain-containing protein n=1 Tax=Circinella minor TaxID=1195481 RepID=A0A8H7SED5_9FUNG|nr:hypothetical protein INT45_012079 [Circinella minor]